METSSSPASWPFDYLTNTVQAVYECEDGVINSLLGQKIRIDPRSLFALINRANSELMVDAFPRIGANSDSSPPMAWKRMGSGPRELYLERSA